PPAESGREAGAGGGGGEDGEETSPDSPTMPIAWPRGRGSPAPTLLHTRQGFVMGTPMSMSPEQARGETVTAASDMYSLGLLFQELFTGNPIYERGLSRTGVLAKAAEGDTLPVEGLTDPDLAELVRRLKALAPEARPSAAAVAERLAWIRGKPGRRRRRLLAAAI